MIYSTRGPWATSQTRAAVPSKLSHYTCAFIKNHQTVTMLLSQSSWSTEPLIWQTELESSYQKISCTRIKLSIIILWHHTCLNHIFTIKKKNKLKPPHLSWFFNWPDKWFSFWWKIRSVDILKSLELFFKITLDQICQLSRFNFTECLALMYRSSYDFHYIYISILWKNPKDFHFLYFHRMYGEYIGLSLCSYMSRVVL